MSFEDIKTEVRVYLEAEAAKGAKGAKGATGSKVPKIPKANRAKIMHMIPLDLQLAVRKLYLKDCAPEEDKHIKRLKAEIKLKLAELSEIENSLATKPDPVLEKRRKALLGSGSRNGELLLLRKDMYSVQKRVLAQAMSQILNIANV